jgi:myosin-5
VCCSQPNDRNVRAAFQRPRVVQQLRCAGVLEAVRVARAGYPTRLPHREFVARFWMLPPRLVIATK